MDQDGDVHPNPGPKVKMDPLPQRWQQAEDRVEPPPLLRSLSIAGVLRRISAVVETRAIASNEVFETFRGATSCLFTDWIKVVTSTIPEATWAAYMQSTKAFTRYVLSRVIKPEAPWSEGLGCALLGGWTTFRAQGEPTVTDGPPTRRPVMASTISKEVSAIRAILRFIGLPIRDDGKLLGTALFRAGCGRTKKSNKPPLRLATVVSWWRWVKGTRRLSNTQHVQIIAMLLVAYAFGIRGELVRKLRPTDLCFTKGKLWFTSDEASKADQAYLAAPPAGRRGISLLAVVQEVLSLWISILPHGWTGRLFPKVTQGNHKGGLFHGGYTWTDVQVRDHNSYISRIAEESNTLNPGWTFHSIRVGLVVDLSRANINHATIKAAGGWRSNAYLVYLIISEDVVAEAISSAAAACDHEVQQPRQPDNPVVIPRRRVGLAARAPLGTAEVRRWEEPARMRDPAI